MATARDPFGVLPHCHQLKLVADKEGAIGSRRFDESTATVPGRERVIMNANEMPRLMAINWVRLPAPRVIR